MTGTTVLAVDDEPSLTSLYETWLGDRYTALTASDGREALSVVNRRTVDVILLDRQMPGPSGDEVLERLRERGFGAKVVMVTAVEPDLDAARMSFDDYLTKPIERDALFGTIESVLARTDYEVELERYCTLARRKAILDANVDSSRLAASSAYRQLVADVEAARETADARRSEVDLLDKTPVFVYDR